MYLNIDVFSDLDKNETNVLNTLPQIYAITVPHLT